MPSFTFYLLQYNRNPGSPVSRKVDRDILHIKFYDGQIWDEPAPLKYRKNIYITGSNAYLLSGELATLLSGRPVSQNTVSDYVEALVEPYIFYILRAMMRVFIDAPSPMIE